MFENEVSRRAFARVLAAGAAVTVLPLRYARSACGPPRWDLVPGMIMPDAHPRHVGPHVDRVLSTEC